MALPDGVGVETLLTQHQVNAERVQLRKEAD
jgi:hypothetical protein